MDDTVDAAVGKAREGVFFRVGEGREGRARQAVGIEVVEAGTLEAAQAGKPILARDAPGPERVHRVKWNARRVCPWHGPRRCSARAQLK